MSRSDRSRSLRWGLVLGVLAGWAGAVVGGQRAPTRAEIVSRADHHEERQDQIDRGAQAFRDNCLMCHAENLTSGQRLTARQWAAEVDKMVGWGAPLPAEQKGDLLAYLTDRYSDRTPAAPIERKTIDELMAALAPEARSTPAQGDATRGQTLYNAQCATCHGADALGAALGTNLVERPVLTRPDEFAEVVREGRRRMPGFARVLSAGQESDILAWLRTRRYGLTSR